MKKKEMPIVAGVSNRHVHLSREDVEILFGKDYQLTPIKDLGQPGQFACKETVIIAGPKGTIEGVRVLGPERKETQVEISLTDAFKLGVMPPV
ncbi:MAG TPA: PduL/EutD family phosphate acyltransferase, partial [Fervidobacterium nodosum]|nr:PduL/EutD family phosphate acyltransferase [Fervidobacterium nodosum]